MLKTGNVLAANDHLHAPLAKLFKEARHSPALSDGGGMPDMGYV